MRVLAIGDIHGCLLHLNDLLALVKQTPDDLVITLGDMVDRGPDTRGVIDRLIGLRKGGTKLVCLRGNHEIMMAEARKGGTSERSMWLSVGGLQTLGSYGPDPGKAGTLDDVPPEHWDFLENGLVDYHETERFIFVHAAVYPDHDLDEQPDDMLFWEFLPGAMRHHSGKTVVCGHTSQKSGVPKVIPGAVCIDTYAHGGGWLTCLDVNEGKYWQVDLMGKTREGRVDYE
jgi:serine/threonine protein phosphatase 1